MVVLIIEKYLCVVLVDISYKSTNEYYESQSVRQNAWGDIENPSMTYNKMGTLFTDLRRQFASFTWMSGVFYLHCWIRMWLIWFWWAHFKLVELTHFKLEELEEFIQLFIFTISSSSKLRNSPAHQLSYVPALPITNGAPHSVIIGALKNLTNLCCFGS